MVGREDDGGRRAGWAEQLLDHLRPAGSDVHRVVAWLADTVQGDVSLQDGTGRLLAGTPAVLDRTLVRALTSGRLATAAWEAAGHHRRLVRVERGKGIERAGTADGADPVEGAEPVGGPAHPAHPAHPARVPPRDPAAAVLAVTRGVPFDRHTFDIVVRTAQVVALVLATHESAEAGRRLRRAAAALRLAILQLLMVEDTVSARRVAAGLWPGLLDADTACVHVLESHPSRRDRLAEECREATRERALVVRCPAVDGHVIVVAPHESEGETLRSLVGRTPDVYLGGSAPHSLAQTAAAYGQAASALAVARVRPGRTAVYAERTRPEGLMDPVALDGFTARLLRPLDTLPHHTRAELLATTRLGLEFTAVNAAKILGVSRNTVRARMDRVERLLRTDFADLTARAAVHVALNAEAGLRRRPGPGAPDEPAPGRFTDLLTRPALRTWAGELLARLDADARNPRRTLRAWVAAGGNAERAARTLGVHAQTVREHVRSAEPVLERQLLASGSDLYEVVLALLAAGDLAEPAPHGTKPDPWDPPVHG
ncbi:helix-turn-helix domain-containing protein [Streptomyces ziwulingensis]|uniref:helix-turn-helix domain-containing protein n=1 Tax=Streptomyces ziwulingensis TaxID=1045501 RepID=UPI003CD0B976